MSLILPKDLQKKLSHKFKALRLFRELKRVSLAQQSGVSEASIKRFESTGEISLKSLLRLAQVLECLDTFEQIFQLPIASSLEEIEKRESGMGNKRKRGRK